MAFLRFYLLLQCFLVFMSGQASASQVDVIPKNIYFVSTQWIDKLGTFRVIRFSSEDEPCFILQNYAKGLVGDLTRSDSICRVQLPDKRIVDVSEDISGGTWFEHFQWLERGLNFVLDSSNGKFNCILNLDKPIGTLAQCSAI
ncbi:MAG: hypothetical protein ACTIM4_14125 [Marinomonas sp.]